MPAILQTWRSQHWRQPLLAEDAEAATTRLTLTMASLLPQEVLAELSEQFSRFSSLNEVGRLAVATARIEGQVTNRRLQELSDRHPRDLTLLLRSLVDHGMLTAHGDRGGTWYTVAEAEAATQQSGPSSQQSGPSSQQQEFEANTHPAIPPGLVDRVAATGWARSEEVRAAIRLVCEGEFVSTREIAQRLNRKASTLQQHYIRRMVDDGELEPRFPGRPTDPNQAYRTRESGGLP